jgi:hypothetical protein
VTDCNAFDAIAADHHYTPSLGATIPASYGAGSDLYNCGALRTEQLVAFMAASLANDAMLTTSLRNLLGVQFELGMFDGPGAWPPER